VLAEISAQTPLTADNAPPSGYRAEDGGFYRGQDSDAPAIGDLRVTFEQVPSQTVSFLAGHSAGTLVPYQGESGYQIALDKPGLVSAAELVREKKQEESIITWILRVVGFIVMFIAFMLMAQPLASLFAVLPFLGGMVEAGAFVIALTLAVPVTLLIIAVAWLAHRPLVGGGLIVAAILAFLLLKRLRGARRPPRTAPAQ